MIQTYLAEKKVFVTHLPHVSAVAVAKPLLQMNGRTASTPGRHRHSDVRIGLTIASERSLPV